MRFGLLAPWLLAAVRLAAACPPPPYNNTREARRWYSVGNPTGDEPKTNNAWPVIREGFQPVRYCWVKESDKQNLQTILNRAIQKWSYAIEHSALEIIPDQANGPNICGEKGVHDDALYIEDVTNSETNSAGVTTQGYWGLEGQTEPGRHYMKFFVEYPDKAKSDPNAHDVLMMAHELGHAIGFDHEHSRPDAAKYLWFYCENLIDYDEVKAKIQPPDTIEEACKSRDTALRYGFSAWAYLPNPHHGKIGQNAWSHSFDYGSIMIYGSYMGGKEPPPTDSVALGKPVLLSHQEGATDPHKGIRRKIKMGGDWADVSDGDRARVAQLYPHVDPDENDGMGANEDGWQGTSIPVAKREVKTAMP